MGQVEQSEIINVCEHKKSHKMDFVLFLNNSLKITRLFLMLRSMRGDWGNNTVK